MQESFATAAAVHGGMMVLDLVFHAWMEFTVPGASFVAETAEWLGWGDMALHAHG